ncbi:MAG: hypothetical protein ACI9J2_002891 [Saprospiraceae bacterium]|jgi:hypothetical protein
MLSTTEKTILATVLALLLIGLGLSHYDETFYRESYVVEDGFIEWLTVLALLSCAGACVYRIKSLWGQRDALFMAVLAFITIVFMFGAGEEISWGQRIFDIETSEWFAENNVQGEMNLHNLRINGVKINKLVFAQGLTLAFLLYLAVLTPLYRKKIGVRSVLDRLAFPCPQNYQIIAYFVVLIIVELLIDSSKRGEMNEIAISSVVFLNLLFPWNKEKFQTRS